VFDRIAHVADEEVVKQIGATFHFSIPNESGYYVDLKNGAGAVTKGEPAEKADVTVTMDADNLLKMFNRELLPTTAFMTGKLTVKGDLTKALTLEKVMKAARESGK
jgi:putative sterol carrier protein